MNKKSIVVFLLVIILLIGGYFYLSNNDEKEKIDFKSNLEISNNPSSNNPSNKPSNPVSTIPSNNPSNKPSNPVSNKPSNVPTSNKPSNPTSNTPVDNRVVLSKEYYNTSVNAEYDEYNIELLFDKYKANLITEEEYRNKLRIAPDKEVEIFKKLISQKKTFMIFEFKDFACSHDGSGLKDFVKAYIKEQKIYIYITSPDILEDVGLYKREMYNKNLVIVKDGKVYKYLDYESDDDLPVFDNYDSFKKWIAKNVKV